ncbi:hypothetical protein EDB89DRAFT_360239 [Lactarius sanguifluus]|nr:hypothetical protein EDB89DRAFT_360239 [Lactarius sanguifluus]
MIAGLSKAVTLYLAPVLSLTSLFLLCRPSPSSTLYLDFMSRQAASDSRVAFTLPTLPTLAIDCITSGSHEYFMSFVQHMFFRVFFFCSAKATSTIMTHWLFSILDFTTHTLANELSVSAVYRQRQRQDAWINRENTSKVAERNKRKRSANLG